MKNLDLREKYYYNLRNALIYPLKNSDGMLWWALQVFINGIARKVQQTCHRKSIACDHHGLTEKAGRSFIRKYWHLSVIYINTCLNMQIPIQSHSPFFHIISNGVSCFLRLCTGYGSYPNIAAESDSPGA